MLRFYSLLQIKNLQQFEALVEQTIDLDALDRHEYLINPSFDEKVSFSRFLSFRFLTSI
jgi:hypothetical protein